MCLAVKKSKSKQWFTVVAPDMFGGKEIGTTLTFTPENLVGKTISLSAVELTNDIGKYYLKLNFKINKVEDNNALTEFVGSECMNDYVSRMVIRHVRRIDTVQKLVTKDGVNVAIKSLATISKKATSSVEVRFREFISDILKRMVENLTLEDFIRKMIANEIKMKVLKECRKIYPVRNFEVRKTEIMR